MHKKRLSAILSGLIFLSSSSMTYAQTGVSVVQTEVAMPAGVVAKSATNESTAKISKDQAMKIVKQTMRDLLDTDIDEKKYQIQYEFRQDYEIPGSNLWQISLNKDEGDKGVYYSLSVNAESGKLIQFNAGEFFRGQQEPTMAVITREQAKTIADTILKKVNPKEASQVEYVDDTQFYNLYQTGRPARYSFRYVRKINGTQFGQNSITIEVDGQTGKITSFFCRWYDNIDIPGIDGAISQEKARELFAQKIGMDLKYITKRDRNDFNNQARSAVLVYAPDFSGGAMLDAKEGILGDWQIGKREEIKSRDLSEAEKNTLFSRLRPVVKLEKELDNSRAMEIMQQKVKETIGEGYEIQYVQYIDGNNDWQANGQKAWTAQIVKKEGSLPGPQPGGNISIDAATGELISIYSFSPYGMNDKEPDESKKIRWEDAYQKAVEAMIKYYPDKAKSVSTLQKYMKSNMYVNGKDIGERFYNFTFTRMVEGIPFQDNYISLRINAYTGSFEEVRSIWDDKLEFPSKKGTMSAEEAKKIFFNSHTPVLNYATTSLNNANDTDERVLKLVYSLQAMDRTMIPTIFSIDAYTGKRIDAMGQEFIKKEDTFLEKMKGHWAEKPLSILAYQGILDADIFSVDSDISLMKAIKMLVRAKGDATYWVKDPQPLKFTNIAQDDPDLYYIKRAVKYGIIEDKEGEFRKETKVTREQMAQFLVKLLNYEKLAKARGIFTLPFEDAKDISSDLYSYVAIGTGLGIFEGSNNQFRPKENTTEIEFAIAVYKALDSLKSVK